MPVNLFQITRRHLKAAVSLVFFVSESGDERSPFAGRDKTFAVLACFRRLLRYSRALIMTNNIH